MASEAPRWLVAIGAWSHPIRRFRDLARRFIEKARPATHMFHFEINSHGTGGRYAGVSACRTTIRAPNGGQRGLSFSVHFSGLFGSSLQTGASSRLLCTFDSESAGSNSIFGRF
jgi:hypothetical protein